MKISASCASMFPVVNVSGVGGCVRLGPEEIRVFAHSFPQRSLRCEASAMYIVAFPVVSVSGAGSVMARRCCTRIPGDILDLGLRTDLYLKLPCVPNLFRQLRVSHPPGQTRFALALICILNTCSSGNRGGGQRGRRRTGMALLPDRLCACMAVRTGIVVLKTGGISSRTKV